MEAGHKLRLNGEPGSGNRIAVLDAQAVRCERIALRETRSIDHHAVAASRLRLVRVPKRRLALQVETHKGHCKRSSPRRPGMSIKHALKSPQRAFVTVSGTSTPSAPWTDAVTSRRKSLFPKPHDVRRDPTPAGIGFSPRSAMTGAETMTQGTPRGLDPQWCDSFLPIVEMSRTGHGAK